MNARPPSRRSDLHGFSRLAIAATTGLTELVEAMHHNIARTRDGPGAATQGSGIAGLVYRSIRGVAGVVGGGIDALLPQIAPMLAEGGSSPRREALVGALNGVLGDYLAATDNPLAITMGMRRCGRPLHLEAQALAAAIPQPGARLAVLVHGLCMNDLQWTRQGHDHGAALARDLGYTPVYLHYNSGRHVSTNGREFAGLMEVLLDEWPVPLDDIAIVAHSMGGLVSRSAWHYGRAAGLRWPARLGKLVFLGTPHHGSPLERGGNWVDRVLANSPTAAPLARLGRIRSAGVTDMRHGNLLDEDWEGQDRFEHPDDRRRPVPLPEDVECFAIAAIRGERVDDLRARLLGDGIVPLASALGRHEDSGRDLALPESRQWTGCGMSHFDLLSRPEVYERIRQWLAAGRR